MLHPLQDLLRPVSGFQGVALPFYLGCEGFLERLYLESSACQSSLRHLVEKNRADGNLKRSEGLGFREVQARGRRVLAAWSMSLNCMSSLIFPETSETLT